MIAQNSSWLGGLIWRSIKENSPFTRLGRLPDTPLIGCTTFALCFTIISVASSLAQGTLIGPSVLNGSFEDGVTSPWLGNAQASQDVFFASQGGWYGVLQRSSNGGALRAIAWQYLTATPNNGRMFIASFDARVGEIGFDSISVDFFARSSDGVFTSATESPLAFPVLSNSEWRTYELQYLLPASWTGDGEISLQILFHRADAVSGVAYTGYLDNIVLTQVPEPSALALLGLGGLLCAARPLKRRPQTD